VENCVIFESAIFLMYFDIRHTQAKSVYIEHTVRLTHTYTLTHRGKQSVTLLYISRKGLYVSVCECYSSLQAFAVYP